MRVSRHCLLPSFLFSFTATGPTYSDKCDRNYSPPLCSDLYHNQECGKRAPAALLPGAPRLRFHLFRAAARLSGNRPATRTATATARRLIAIAVRSLVDFTGGTTARPLSSTGRLSSIGLRTRMSSTRRAPLRWSPASTLTTVRQTRLTDRSYFLYPAASSHPFPVPPSPLPRLAGVWRLSGPLPQHD